MIHKTAIVSEGAKIGKDVEIGPYSIINADVEIGDGTKILSHAVIDSNTKIGKNCTIFQYASIGTEPQAIKFKGEETYAEIGDGSIIREFVTLHRGVGEKNITRVGKNALIMAYCHIAHDCIIGDNVILSNSAALAGHIQIGNNVIVGGLVGIHQFTRIGDYAFIGGKSTVVKDVPPFTMAVGDRAKLRGLNSVGLMRNNFSKESISLLKKAYRYFFRIDLAVNEAIERVKAEVKQIDEVKTFVDFIQSSERGITR